MSAAASVFFPLGVVAHWPDWTAALAAAIACGCVSPLIVQRRWAFLGEAIGHSGFGGAGVVWLLAAALPGVAALRSVEATAAGVLLAALAVAIGVGIVAGDPAADDRDRNKGSGFEIVVGLFLVGTLALGLLAASAYKARFGGEPARVDALLFGGRPAGGGGGAGPVEALAAAAVALTVVAGLAMYRREILAWSLDPIAARLAGVGATAARLGLLVAIAASAALAARLTGVILVTALLVLPGAIATRLGKSLAGVIAASVCAAGASVVVGLSLSGVVPPGPTVVVALIVLYAASALAMRVRT